MVRHDGAVVGGILTWTRSVSLLKLIPTNSQQLCCRVELPEKFYLWKLRQRDENETWNDLNGSELKRDIMKDGVGNGREM